MAIRKKQHKVFSPAPVCVSKNTLFTLYFLHKLIKVCSLVNIRLENTISESTLKKSLLQLGLPKSLLIGKKLLGQEQKKWISQRLHNSRIESFTKQNIYQNFKYLAKCTANPRLYFRLYLLAFLRESDSIIETIVDELISDYEDQGFSIPILLETIGISEYTIQQVPEYESKVQSLLLNGEHTISTDNSVPFNTSEFLQNISISAKFRSTITEQPHIKNIESLIRHAYQLSSPCKLQSKDFDSEQFFTLHHYLKSALNNESRGVNILLHGEPGVGKTELVHTLAKSLRCDLFDISNNNNDTYSGGNLSNDIERELLSTQLLCGQLSNIILLVDECDDFFYESPLSGRNIRKQHINQALEYGIIPTVWITNRPYNIEESYIRRFDIVMEIKSQEPKNYETNVRYLSKGLRLSTNYIQHICKNKHLTIAHIEKSIKVTKALGLTATMAQKQMDILLNGYLIANDQNKLDIKSNSAQFNYDLSLTNCIGHNLAEVKQGIKCLGEARILLYGPPGTGKSAYAAHVSENLKIPLIIKKSSDLLGSFVGETERNIAMVFDKAKEKNAILLIDEVDSFLNSRESHTNNWESTMVNEMLTQMENFEGIFIATTNFNKKLDHAVARRFDFKIKLDYLTTDQCLKMFEYLVTPSGTTVKKKLAQLNNLTPGDFSVVARKCALLGKRDESIVLEYLQLESLYKEPIENAIGFIKK